MITIGQKLPAFSLKASVDTSLEFPVITDASYAGKWKVFVFWPKDFTFVCPTEILGFDAINRDFLDRDAQLLGASTDSDFVHHAWRKSREDLGAVKYPWLADIKKDLANALGIIEPNEGVAYRATIIVDPDNIVRYVAVNDLNVGRNPQEVLRVLDALQTDELCPCAWNKGEETLKAA
ncbi:MAG: peroxiredoxin [Rhodospirillaceae bacterium]|nr:peroxiredoxin [Rhodospirillaceae bacterium]